MSVQLINAAYGGGSGQNNTLLACAVCRVFLNEKARGAEAPFIKKPDRPICRSWPVTTLRDCPCGCSGWVLMPVAVLQWVALKQFKSSVPRPT
jgi:hypothetical protein